MFRAASQKPFFFPISKPHLPDVYSGFILDEGRELADYPSCITAIFDPGSGWDSEMLASIIV